MGKVLKEEDFKEIIYQEKIKLYEMENTELQYILKEYWQKKGKKRPEFPSIREEIYYILNNSEDSIRRKIKNGLRRLRGK